MKQKKLFFIIIAIGVILILGIFGFQKYTGSPREEVEVTGILEDAPSQYGIFVTQGLVDKKNRSYYLEEDTSLHVGQRNMAFDDWYFQNYGKEVKIRGYVIAKGEIWESESFIFELLEGSSLDGQSIFKR